MAKAVVSSGGGGSFGKGVSWADALAEEMAGPVIPADAESIEDISVRLQKRNAHMTPRAIILRMGKLVDAGEYATALGRRQADHGPKRYYWPNPKRKP